MPRYQQNMTFARVVQGLTRVLVINRMDRTHVARRIAMYPMLNVLKEDGLSLLRIIIVSYRNVTESRVVVDLTQYFRVKTVQR